MSQDIWHRIGDGGAKQESQDQGWSGKMEHKKGNHILYRDLP